MPKLLTQAEIDRFHSDGCIHPIRVMPAAQADRYRARLEAFERPEGKPDGKPLKRNLPHKPYLLFDWLAELVRNARILDAVEDLYGPDLLCWNANFFIKDALDPAFVTWHQDSTYFGLSKPDLVTAWVALTESNDANGAMAYIPGSHKREQLPHRDTFARHNLLSRGQEISVPVDESLRRVVRLSPGEISLHHARLVHNSPPNPSGSRRIGIAIRYIPTYVAQTAGADSATLVRGEDRYHHFEMEPRPAGDLDPAALAFHRRITERSARILYRRVEREEKPADSMSEQ